MLGRRLSHTYENLNSNKEGGTVGTKLVPEGREEVDELEGLSASSALVSSYHRQAGSRNNIKHARNPH